jgi:hypothetical protein
VISAYEGVYTGVLSFSLLAEATFNVLRQIVLLLPGFCRLEWIQMHCFWYQDCSYEDAILVETADLDNTQYILVFEFFRRARASREDKASSYVLAVAFP